jgi:hypothetical protein
MFDCLDLSAKEEHPDTPIFPAWGAAPVVCAQTLLITLIRQSNCPDGGRKARRWTSAR